MPLGKCRRYLQALFLLHHLNCLVSFLGQTIYESESGPDTPIKTDQSHSFNFRERNGSKSCGPPISHDNNSTNEREVKSHDQDFAKEKFIIHENTKQKRIVYETKSQGVTAVSVDAQQKHRHSESNLRRKSTSNPQHRNTEFVKKTSKKDKEALNAYIEWKTQGKKGDPPTKVSL